MKRLSLTSIFVHLSFVFAFILTSCSSQPRSGYILTEEQTATPIVEETATPFSDRPVYAPGTLVDYVAQSGDSLDLLSKRFEASRKKFCGLTLIFRRMSQLYRLVSL